MQVMQRANAACDFCGPGRARDGEKVIQRELDIHIESDTERESNTGRQKEREKYPINKQPNLLRRGALRCNHSSTICDLR